MLYAIKTAEQEQILLNLNYVLMVEKGSLCTKEPTLIFTMESDKTAYFAVFESCDERDGEFNYLNTMRFKK